MLDEQHPLPAKHWSETPIARIIKPIQDFIHGSAASGIVLFGVTILALIIANTGLAAAYDHILHEYIAISIGPWELRENVLHWINDGLMAIFFLLVGLEIKREVLVGELSTLRAAMLPIVAAIGGAVVPALIYFAFNPPGSPGSAGWGIPMATDIAFALGCLALLGSRVPFSLKIFLTAVAIVDDLIAVLVIAIFYTNDLNVTALGVGLMILSLLFVLNLLGVRWLPIYLAVGVGVWVFFLESGVHATIAGVLLALVIPSRYRIDGPTFIERVRGLTGRFEQAEFNPDRMMADETQQSVLLALEEAVEQAQAPLQKLEHSLHTPVMFGIMPIFALANAGVPLHLSGLEGDATSVMAGIFMGLVFGKPLGLVLACYLAVRAGLVSLPEGATWLHMWGVGILAGIGFTMSLFIAALGLGEGTEFLDAAKIAILIASVVAGSLGLAVLYRASDEVPEASPQEAHQEPV